MEEPGGVLHSLFCPSEWGQRTIRKGGHTFSFTQRWHGMNPLQKRKKQCSWCHETTARAARLERSGSVTQVRPVSNGLVVQGFWRDILEDSATLPPMKGPRGFVRGEAW